MWTSLGPTMEGFYWFYGDPYKGGMGIDYRDDCPPIEPQMYLVEVATISNGLMAMTNGTIISLQRFDKARGIEGYVGYWKHANLPEPPIDIERLFE